MVSAPIRPAIVIAALLLVVGALLAGCAGSSGGGGGKRLSDVVAEKEDEGREGSRDSRARGDESRTRTRTDHQEGSGSSGDESWDSGSGGGSSDSVVSWLFTALFGGGNDDEYWEYDEVERDPAQRATGPYVEDEIGGEGEGGGNAPDVSLGRFTLGYRYDNSHLAGDAVSGFETGMVTAGFGPHDRAKIYLGYFSGHGDFGRADIAASLDDLTEKGLELGLRGYLTPDHTLLGSYIMFGGRITSIGWRYRDPVEITTDGGGVTRIDDDGNLAGGPFVGLGVSILQTRYLHLGTSLMTGIRFTANQTYEGLENDIFKDVGYWQWNLEGSIRF